jgi:TetR/AcrR family transcriptional regulator, transcriptional repressor for nem operon
MPTNQKSEPRSLTARGAATRARIVEAAADLIYAHGVEQTSLDEVMAASGVSKSQLYHYFADKDALVLDVIARQTERVLDAQRPHLEALDSLPAFKAWRNAILRLNKAAHGKGCPLGSLASELANDSEPARKRLADSFSMWRDRIQNGLAKMRERGELSASADPHDLALALLSAVEGGLLLAKTTHSSRPLELSLDMAIDHVARHITARTSAPTARVRQ